MLKRATGLVEVSLPQGAKHDLFKGNDGTDRFLTQANDFGMCRAPHQRFENGYAVATVPHVRPWLKLRVSEPALSKHLRQRMEVKADDGRSEMLGALTKGEVLDVFPIETNKRVEYDVLERIWIQRLVGSDIH
ncbi:hypothetical protein CCHR01_17134 [Colletotrichum chrysophilum]|uniref:Uncharacterized protein n=1 Tax=Colletotrichum chrysophilum TaxID=1836956 RepID=A0AAD9EA69_9PEZI|nr:hypothetical protein CCHR01_17134 [Colletotrichum chrysophilum]